MKTAFQVEAFSEWFGQLLVAADHLIEPPLSYKVLRIYFARRPGHNHPAGHNHPNDWITHPPPSNTTIHVSTTLISHLPTISIHPSLPPAICKAPLTAIGRIRTVGDDVGLAIVVASIMSVLACCALHTHLGAVALYPYACISTCRVREQCVPCDA